MTSSRGVSPQLLTRSYCEYTCRRLWWYPAVDPISGQEQGHGDGAHRGPDQRTGCPAVWYEHVNEYTVQ